MITKEMIADYIEKQNRFRVRFAPIGIQPLFEKIAKENNEPYQWDYGHLSLFDEALCLLRKKHPNPSYWKLECERGSTQEYMCITLDSTR